MDGKIYKVLIVEDHPIASESFSDLIDAHPSLSVCGLSKTVSEIDSLLLEQSPDVILMDIYLPEDQDSPVRFGPMDQRGLRAGLKLKSSHPEIGVLFTSALVSEPTVNIVIDSQHKGGLGIITKEADPDDFVNALLAVAKGNRFVDSHTSISLLRPKPSVEQELRQMFSSKEKEVLKLIAEGCSRDQIAIKSSIGIGRVDRILEQLRHKLRDREVSIGGSADYTYVHLTHLAVGIGLVGILPIETRRSSDRDSDVGQWSSDAQ